jgi:hypothetical protein
MLSTDNTTEMITALAEQHITEAIVNAAKGKTINKRTKKLTLSDEIKACFDIEKFLNNAAATIEELILRKVEEAVSAAASNEKPKKKRAPAAKKVVVTETETEAVPSHEETKPKKKRAAKKVTVEASVQASAEIDTSVEEPVSQIDTSVEEPVSQIEKPKLKKARTSKKVTTADVEEAKPKGKKTRAPKKDKPVDVSDSDTSDSEKPKKKRNIKKVTAPVLPGVTMPDVEVEVEVEAENDVDDSSVATADFIRPLSISNELEEEELSDIEEEA